MGFNLSLCLCAFMPTKWLVFMQKAAVLAVSAPLGGVPRGQGLATSPVPSADLHTGKIFGKAGQLA